MGSAREVRPLLPHREAQWLAQAQEPDSRLPGFVFREWGVRKYDLRLDQQPGNACDARPGDAPCDWHPASRERDDVRLLHARRARTCQHDPEVHEERWQPCAGLLHARRHVARSAGTRRSWPVPRCRRVLTRSDLARHGDQRGHGRELLPGLPCLSLDAGAVRNQHLRANQKEDQEVVRGTTHADAEVLAGGNLLPSRRSAADPSDFAERSQQFAHGDRDHPAVGQRDLRSELLPHEQTLRQPQVLQHASRTKRSGLLVHDGTASAVRDHRTPTGPAHSSLGSRELDALLRAVVQDPHGPGALHVTRTRIPGPGGDR